MNIFEKINKIEKEIKEVIGNKKAFVAFSGGMDSTVATALTKNALGKERIELIHVLFGRFTYSKTIENVKRLSDLLDLKLVFLDGSKIQADIMKHGPNCNQCTRVAKLKTIKNYVKNRGIIISGSNQSDTWGQMGLKIFGNSYSPLAELNKEEIKKIADVLNIKILKVGENSVREGCKLKHLLKMMINYDYHGSAVDLSNELLISILDKYNFQRDLANVKIIGPLSKNIALINIKPLPDKRILDEIVDKMINIYSIDEVYIVDRPIKLKVLANPGIYRNENSRKWIEIGRIRREFAQEVIVEWKESKNNRLWTFHVVDFQFI